MNSTAKLSFLRVVWLSAAAAGCLSSALAGGKSVWLAENAAAAGAGMILPDSKGSYDCEVADSTGITVGEKPRGGSDAKSLVFSGEQVLAFRTLKAIPAPFEGFSVKARVNVSELAADTDTTLLRHGTSWEIRYLTNRSAFLFIVWHEADVTSEVSVPAPPGDWVELSAGFRPDKMVLTVDGQKAEGVPKAPMFEGPKPQSLFLGASAPRPVDGVLPRAFRGAVADLEIDWE